MTTPPPLQPPPAPAPGPTPARPEVAQAAEAVVGAEYIKLLQPLLGRLRDAYTHANRVLHFDTVLVALLMGFYNTSVRSLRTMEDQSAAEGFAELLPVDRVCAAPRSPTPCGRWTRRGCCRSSRPWPSRCPP